MKTVRLVARMLFYISRALAIVCLAIAVYAAVVLLLAKYTSATLPMEISGDKFVIFCPFTKSPFLLGDYTSSYLTTNLLTLCFYGLFLWLLSGVFQAFKQERLFSQKGFLQLSRFYAVNLTVPVLLVLLVSFFGEEVQDIIRITFLHIVIGVFAFFMAAIFKQGLLLQEEQDLIF